MCVCMRVLFILIHNTEHSCTNLLYTIIEYVTFVVERIETHSNYNTYIHYMVVTWKVDNVHMLRLSRHRPICSDCHRMRYDAEINIRHYTVHMYTYDIMRFIKIYTYNIIYTYDR